MCELTVSRVRTRSETQYRILVDYPVLVGRPRTQVPNLSASASLLCTVAPPLALAPCLDAPKADGTRIPPLIFCLESGQPHCVLTYAGHQDSPMHPRLMSLRSAQTFAGALQRCTPRSPRCILALCPLTSTHTYRLRAGLSVSQTYSLFSNAVFECVFGAFKYG